MIKRFYILLLAIVASVGMSFAQASIVSSGTKGGMSYTFYDNGLLEISGSGALPGRAFTNWDGGFGTSVKNIRFAEDCEVYGLGDMWFGCYTENSQLETVEINSVVPIMFSASSGEGIFYRQDGAVTLTITAPGIVDVEGEIIGNYGSPVNMILNLPASTVFEKKWFSGLRNNFAVTIPTGATGHIPAGYIFKDSYTQRDYDDMVAHGHEDMFWEMNSHLVEGVDYTNGVESTFVITAENASQIFGQAAVSFQAPTQASNSEWVLWRKSDLKEFPDMSSGDQKVCKDVTVKVNNGVYNTDSGWGLHFESSGEDGIQFVAPEGKVFKRIVILNEYGTFSDPNWSYDGNYKKWSGSANTVGFVGNICGISLIEFEVEASAPANSCGDGLTWEFDSATGALTISYDGEGTGVMDNYSWDPNAAPWYAYKDAITSVSFPEGITTIGAYAFVSCDNAAFTTVTIPEGVTALGVNAFYNCDGIQEITIPSTVTTIDVGAIYDCKAVNSITSYIASPTNLHGFAIYGYKNTCTLYVPYASIDAYKAAECWKEIPNIAAIPGTLTPEGVIEKINAIGTVELTAECKAKIDEARAAYDALSDGDKAQVTNLTTLTDAETAYAQLLAQAVKAVKDQIDALPATPLTDATKKLSEYNKVTDAREAYDALSDEEKAAVDNYSKLTDAEAAFAAISGGTKPVDIVWDINTGINEVAINTTSPAYEGITVTTGKGNRFYQTTVDPIMLRFFFSGGAGRYAFAKEDGSHFTKVVLISSVAMGTWLREPSRIGTDWVVSDDYKKATWIGDADTVKIWDGASATAWVDVDSIVFTVNGTASPLADAQAALDKINAIPSPVVYTPECGAAIKAAREAVDALGANASLLDEADLNKLPAAEATYAGLLAEKVAPVIAAIDAVPATPLTDATKKLSEYNKVTDAREAYDALSDEEKAAVDNYSKLTDAEAAFAAIPSVGSETVITWDKNTGIEKISGTTTSPAYEGITISIKGGGFGPQDDMLRFNIAGLGLSFEFANTLGGNFQKIVISSTNAMPSTPLAGMGEGWAASSGNKIATWTGDAATVKIWDGLTATSFWDVNTIQFTLGATVSATEAAQAALDKINAIPQPVVLSDECNAAIKAAREAVDALGANASLLDEADLQKLTDAEAALTALNQAVADEVIAKINNIPQPVELKLATRDSINNARAAYDALTADQQALVSNYQTLLDAEATMATLNPGGGMPADALNGKFTINAGGDQIAFAKGNLQATTEDLGEHWTWSFAANQWDLIGNAVANTAITGSGTVSANGTVDLFGWSTPTTYYGIHNSKNSDYYSGDFREWGENITGATWKTPSPNDWIYIISNRADAAQKQGQATVNGVNGYIFLPDEWELPTGLSFTAKPNNWTANVYDGADWTAMENAGAVFLPKSPWRSENTVAPLTAGYYWSSDYNSYSQAMAYSFQEDASIKGTGINRFAGIPVRLVTADAEGASPLDSAQAVKDLIDAIPAEITLDDACVKAIDDARAAYDALSEAAQGALDAATVQKLTDAEAALTALNQAVADEVIAKINAIPTPVELKLATRDSIESARAAYDALNAAQQALVSNYQKLTDAEAALASLNPGVPPATPLDSTQAVKDLIDVIPTPVEYPTSGPAIEAALNAFNELSDAAKGALDAADVQKLNDAATQYAALEAITAIEAIPAEIVYDPAIKAAIETAREKYDALSDASKELVDDEVVAKLTNAEEAWAILVAKIEHNVSYMGKDGELKNEKVALLHIPDPAPDFNGYEFVRWDVKGGDFLEEGLHVKAVYTPIITTNPQGFDTLAYNGLAQELVKAGVAKEGHIEYSLYPEEPESWSAELPEATIAGVYAIYYKLVREGHADYIAPEPTMATIAKVPVTYTAPTAVENLVYNASNQTLIAAGQTNDGTFEYSLDPTLPDSWSAELPQAKDAGTYSVYYRVQGDLNHLDSTAVDPIAVTIAKAELTATADDKDLIYGDAVPAYTVTYAGWQGDDDAAVLTGDIAFACEYAQTSNVGEYTITPSGIDAANYAITFVNGKVTVAKAELMITADDKNVIYGDAVPEYTATYSGWKNTDDASVISGLIYTCEYAPTSNVGEYTIVPSGATATNYNISYTNGKVTVAKADLMITADDKNVTYGDAVPEYTATYSGWKNTDDASVVSGLIVECEYAPTSNVGEYTIVPSGATATNYNISYTNGKVTVAKADLMITADDKNVTYGDAVPEYTATYSGWKNTDDASVVSGLIFECEYAPTSNVGEYTITPSGATATNYEISFTNGKVTVSKATLTITAENKEMIYGDEHPEFTVTYSGWINGDDESMVSGLQFSTPYAPGSPIGTYAINPNSATALNYAIIFVDGTLTVNKAHVYVSDAEAQIAKFADGHANAVVLEQGILNGIKLNDPIAHVTTAAFSSADVAEHLTITLFYELTGDAALLNNYNLDPTSDIFTNEGVIIEPFIPNNEDKPEDKEATVNEGIEIYAYGYCDGSGYSLKYHLESGNPDQYKIDFADSRFIDVDWTNLTTVGKDGTIDINIPVDLPTGDYTMTVYFRDSRFDWLESRQLNVTFHVNLPETYVRPLFDNVIALVDTCECLTDIQWYWRANSTELWQPIEGANGYYYHVDGKLTGEYFVSAKMNGEPTYTCGQADMETLYGADQQAKAPVVRAYPNPVVNSTTVTIENSIEWVHNIRIVNLMGAEVMNATFEGDKTSVEMSGYPQGNYMISVDGIVVKVMKK